jgi:nucleoside-diphosphate-sugar epimerase
MARGARHEVRDVVAVADIVAASMAAIAHASAAAPVVNVATGIATRIVDLAHMICAARGLDGARHVRFGPPRGSDIVHSVADTRLLRDSRLRAGDAAGRWAAAACPHGRPRKPHNTPSISPRIG